MPGISTWRDPAVPYIVHPDKITKYLLNAGHKSGAVKARFFLAKGFSLSDPQKLADSLKCHPIEAALKSVSGDPERKRLMYEWEITIPDGSRTCMRSVWIEASDGSYARLISAYPSH
jgi:hypothetical protein